MIQIELKDYTLTAKGHANYDEEKGKDIVCAAISTLICTLVDSLDGLAFAMEDGSLDANLIDGDAFVTCKPKPEYEANVQMAYWTILNGLKMVADSYPENVTLMTP